jgi:hypothetical protein
MGRPRPRCRHRSDSSRRVVGVERGELRDCGASPVASAAEDLCPATPERSLTYFCPPTRLAFNSLEGDSDECVVDTREVHPNGLQGDILSNEDEWLLTLWLGDRTSRAVFALDGSPEHASTSPRSWSRWT